MSISIVYILDQKGKVIMSRDYRGDIDASCIEKFMGLYMDKEEEGCLTPIIQSHEATFIHIKWTNIILVAACKKNVNVTLVLAFLYKCLEVFIEYFKVKFGFCCYFNVFVRSLATIWTIP